jgi:general secretion pathway protein G
MLGAAPRGVNRRGPGKRTSGNSMTRRRFGLNAGSSLPVPGSVRDQRGFTFVEMLATVAIILVLASALVPVYRWEQKRRYERWLRADLQLMRDSIDAYKKLCDEQKIQQQDVEQMCYPLTLEELVEGVEIVSTDASEVKKMRFLRRIPEDPFTGEATWGLRSYQDDFDSTSWGGENVYDVYSESTLLALDGVTRYNEW